MITFAKFLPNAFITAVCSIIIISNTSAQSDNLKFVKIGLEQGLSQSSVYDIAQDSLGFIWFGTQDGLNRYDGYSVKVFKNIPGNNNSLSDNIIMSLHNDKKGNLWIGTMNGGLNRYVPSEDKFYHYYHNKNNSESISENDITKIFEDSRGNIWIGTRNKGLNLYNKESERFLHFLYENKNKDSGGSSIKSICEDQSGNLWAATNGGLSELLISSRTGLPEKIINYNQLPEKKLKIKSNNIKTMHIDKQGAIWIGTWGEGLIRYDPNNHSCIQYNNNDKTPGSLTSNFIQNIYEDSHKNLLIATHNSGVLKYNYQSGKFEQYSNYAVLSFFEDRSDILWLGTFIDGVVVSDEKMNRFRHYYDNPDDPDDLNDDFVYTILQDKDGELWVRSYTNGVYRFDKQRKKVINYKLDLRKEYNPNNNRVISMSESSDGSIWIGTQKGVLYNFNKRTEKFSRYENIDVEEITLIFEDSRGILWIGNNRGKLFNFRKNKGTFKPFYLDTVNASPSGRITTIFEGRNGIIWLGTLRDGLYYFLPGSHTYKHYRIVPSVNKSLNSNSVISIYEDNSGIIWIGTVGGGLNKFNIATGNFNYYTEQDGLSNNIVYGILPDKQGNLWLSTNKGISRFNIKNEVFRNFDGKDGLQGNEFNSGSYYAGSDGELFFGGTNGFNSFYPEEIAENKYIPPVLFTNFKVFDESIQFPRAITSVKEIELSYSQNFFSFEFVALNYTLPEKNQYAYMLEGFDKKWHYVSANKRNASYTNIDPGKYIIRIKGSNNDGVWNEAGASIVLIINPPFWETWWFRGIIILLTAGIIILLYNYRVSQLLNIERMRIRIASDLHDEIGSSLGSIVLRSRALQKEKCLTEKAGNELERIHRTAKQTAAMMRDIVWFINPDFDTLDDMILKMNDTAQFLLCDIPYDFKAPEEKFSTKLSLEFRRNIFLSYKESLHNIVKHSNASKVFIEISFKNKYFQMKISDNGKGFCLSKDPGELKNRGNGLRNVKKRIESLKGHSEINSEPGKGTTVFISVKTT